jgi:signal transduction histidine kinase
VELRGTPNQIELEVIDHGVGFDPDDADRKYGLGLTSMRERIASVNGDVVIDSRASAGTSFRARVPMARCQES